MTPPSPPALAKLAAALKRVDTLSEPDLLRVIAAWDLVRVRWQRINDLLTARLAQVRTARPRPKKATPEFLTAQLFAERWHIDVSTIYQRVTEKKLTPVGPIGTRPMLFRLSDIERLEQQPYVPPKPTPAQRQAREERKKQREEAP